MWYAIIFITGIVLAIISLFMLRESLSFLKNTERATATVIEMVRVSGSDGATYKPVFKFKTLTNQEIIYRYSVSSSPPSWSVGDEVTVAYDPQSPEKAKLLTYFGSFSWTVILLSIAMPLLVIGGGFYLSRMVLK